MNVVLLCCILSALAGGVLAAYWLSYGMFEIFRIHSMQVAQQRAELRAQQVVAAELATG